MNKINDKINELTKELITDSSISDYDKIKIIHDYIINNTKYDVERNEKGNSKYTSYIAIGPLFDGYATCNGYTDVMALFLTKLNIDNFKVVTTPEEVTDILQQVMYGMQLN
jgi:transglutaminase/protease-like cytokinesis protein 3